MQLGMQLNRIVPFSVMQLSSTEGVPRNATLLHAEPSSNATISSTGFRMMQLRRKCEAKHHATVLYFTARGCIECNNLASHRAFTDLKQIVPEIPYLNIWMQYFGMDLHETKF